MCFGKIDLACGHPQRNIKKKINGIGTPIPRNASTAKQSKQPNQPSTTNHNKAKNAGGHPLMGFDQWKLVKSSISFHERYIRVRKDILESPQGEETDYVYLEDPIPGTVVIVAVTSDNRIPLVRQYRYPIQKHQYNLPGGAIDEGETPEQAAARELKEETGISASEWISLGTFHPMSSHHTREAHLFVAKGLSFGNQELDPYEDLQVEYFPVQELMEKMVSGSFSDMELCCAVLLAKAKNLI